MKNSILLLISLVLFALLTGCVSSEIVQNTRGVPSESQETSKSMGLCDNLSSTLFDKLLFNRFHSSNGQQVDTKFQQIISTIEARDAILLKENFSQIAIDSADNLDSQIAELFNFYEGEMVSFLRHGPGAHTTKDDSVYLKELYASYEVETTSKNYWVSFKFRSIDTQHPEKVGILHINIIEATDHNSANTYWGGEVPGITIDSSTGDGLREPY